MTSPIQTQIEKQKEKLLEVEKEIEKAGSLYQNKLILKSNRDMLRTFITELEAALPGEREMVSHAAYTGVNIGYMSTSERYGYHSEKATKEIETYLTQLYKNK